MSRITMSRVMAAGAACVLVLTVGACSHGKKPDNGASQSGQPQSHIQAQAQSQGQDHPSGAESETDRGEFTGFTNYDGIQKEYQASVKKLTYPDGYTPPAELDVDKGTTFQRGWGDTRASKYWECSWQRNWLKNYDTNPGEAQKALDQLDKTLSMSYMKPPRGHESVTSSFKDQLSKAKLGDPSGFQQNVELNCPDEK